MQTGDPRLGAYHIHDLGLVDSNLLDCKPEIVLKGKIQNKFGTYRNFQDFSGGLSELDISKVVTGRRKLNHTQALIWTQKLDLPLPYVLHWFGKPHSENEGQ